jgi:serine/threonine protein kinase
MIAKESLNTEAKENRFFEEIYIFRSLHHPFIPEFFDFSESDLFYMIVMEHVPNGSLSNFIRKNNKMEGKYAQRLFLQLITVRDCLHHQKHDVYRDIKTENIIRDRNGNIRVIDFGFSKIFQSDHSLFSTKCGSPLFVAPEVKLGQPYNNKCDIWSSGVILYEMICGKLPFKKNNLNFLFKQIQNSEPNYDEIPKDISNLIQNLLKKDPNDRISLSDIKNHPYLLSFDYNHILASTLERIKTLYEDSSFNVDFDDGLLEQNQFITFQI